MLPLSDSKPPVRRAISVCSHSRITILWLFIACTIQVQGEEPQARTLAATDLLQYLDSAGEARVVANTDQWGSRRVAIVRGMTQVMGELPAVSRRVDLNVRVEEEVDAGKYIRNLITFQSEPGSRTPAYLCVPKSFAPIPGSAKREGKARAVLCLHPTDGAVKHKVVVNLGGRKGRPYAAELAERGYVTISPAYPHMANYWPNLGKLGYTSGTMKAIWDNTRALDLLDSLEYVDSSRGYAAIGHSLGGHTAIYTVVLDNRIQVVATSCGFDAFEDYYGGGERNWYFGRGWCQIRYMPKLSDYRGRLEDIPFNFPELLGALAPRHVFINAPLRDGNFRWESVDKCVAAAEHVYALFGSRSRLVKRHPDTAHSFSEEMRLEAYQMIDSVLRAGEK